ncbi:MAG: nickel pincer cofactor biosynthesis protein LarB [Methanomicrobiales archaeon]|nr:nickel pincer cofactor biosynthesis protein LarB [Methanomicrobiales archaeon]
MHPYATIRDILEEVKTGQLSLEEAERTLIGLRLEQVEDIARLDVGRSTRCGMPEVILAEGKETPDLIAIALHQVRASGRSIISRVGEEQLSAFTEVSAKEGLTLEYMDKARMIVLSDGTPAPSHGGVVGILAAGTADIRVAEEVRVIAREMGCTVHTAYDVGVAGIHRLFSALQEMSRAQVFVVVAGREGTLPSIVAGLVDRPVIGVPVSTGYGHMGKGEGALASMLQSCSVLAVVNIDAGVVAGAFAARIARMVSEHE